MNGKVHTSEDLAITPDLLNPFVHHLELSTTYDKIKTAFLTVAVLPFRVFAIMVLLIMAWILACIGLMGLSEEELRQRPITGWRRDAKVVVCWVMRGLFLFGGFHWVTVRGKQAPARDAPILAVAPHSSYFDALPVIFFGGPSVVAKGETGHLPFFGINMTSTSREVDPFLEKILNYPGLYELRSNAYKDTTRRKLTPLICKLGKGTYAAGGMTIIVKGRQASRKEAPILVVAPHSTFIDAGITYVTGFPSIIVRRESGLNPFIGKLINYTQPVYVWREDPNSRQNTIKEIIERATSDQDWPQILIFPEGTCTNRSCLITFKPGAFYPGVPIQPVCIRYPNKLDTVTWTWEGPGALKLLWLTLTQVHSSCEIEFLPVYTPSEDEKHDPKLYANNVRHLMAKALGVPVSDYTYDDCRLMTRAKQMNVPFASGLVEVQKLRQKLGLAQTNAEEKILNKLPQILGSQNGQISYKEFSRHLEISSSNEVLQQLFRIYDKDCTGIIDFREYLLGVLVISKASNVAEMVELAFKIFDCGGKGELLLADVAKALHYTMAITPEEVQRIFREVDTKGRGYITFGEFEQYTKQKSEYSTIFRRRKEGCKTTEKKTV